MGRPAARDVDRHTCWWTHPAPHEGGLITVDRVSSVYASDIPVAVLLDPAYCKVGPPNLIVLGSPNVLIEGLPAARKYDLTMHTGMILEGDPTVLIGRDSAATLLALAVLRIQNSEYAKTPEGKAMVKLLSEKLADGSLSVQDLSGFDSPGRHVSGAHINDDTGVSQADREKAGYGWAKKGAVAVDDDNLDDVDGTAGTLVHEGKHAQGGDEAAAREEGDRFYDEQKKEGYENPESEADRAHIGEGNLDKRLKDLGYDKNK